MRPLWELATARGIAEHLRLQGSSDAASYSAAALVTRALDRHFGFQRIFAGYTFTDRLAVDDPEKTAPQYLAAMRSFWAAFAGPPGERRRLLELAQAALLRSGRTEIVAARTLASDVRSMEGAWGKLGAVWESGTWGLAGFGSVASFGGLRDEMAASGETVLAAYDRLVSAARERKAVVEKFQIWAKRLEWYTGRLDGIWGPKTETAFVRTVPMAEGRLSELRDTVPLKPAMGLEAGLSDIALAAAAIAVLITRDLWLADHPEMLTKTVAPIALAEPVYVPGGAAQVVVSYPKAERPVVTPAAGGGSQVVVSYPKVDGTSTEVSVPVPSAGDVLREVAQAAKPSRLPSTDQLIAGGAILAGLTIVAVSVIARRRQKRRLALPAARGA